MLTEKSQEIKALQLKIQRIKKLYVLKSELANNTLRVWFLNLWSQIIELLLSFDITEQLNASFTLKPLEYLQNCHAHLSPLRSLNPIETASNHSDLTPFYAENIIAIAFFHHLPLPLPSSLPIYTQPSNFMSPYLDRKNKQ